MGPTDTEDSPLYGADDFRIYCMKVLPCSKRYCHDWTTCPFAHPGEKARRRDPRVFNYTGIACPDMKKEGACPRREACPYAHNVFEYWLHPTRYRTQLCNDDNRCKRRICFFAHTLEELRVPSCKPFVPPEALAAATPPDAVTDASGGPSEWSQNYGIPKGPGTGAFAGGHTDQALADLQSKLASLQLAVQSTQPGTKLHQDQEMMINVLSAALRNAYVINSFSAAAPVHARPQHSASAEELSAGYAQLPHAFQQEQQQQAALSLPSGDARALMYGSLPQHGPQQGEPRSNSNPELAPWQANSLRQSLAMEYARMSMDSMHSGGPPDPRRMSNAELAYHMGLPEGQLGRASNSDYSRMSLSDTAARLSLSDYSSRMSLSESSGQGSGLWQAGPSPSSAILQQRAFGQDSNIFRSTFYHTEAMQPPRAPCQSQSSSVPHHWSPYGMPPSLPASSQPHPGSHDVNEPLPYGQPPIYPPSTQPFGHRAGHEMREPTIRASLMDHWHQQSMLNQQPRPSLESAPSIDQHTWPVPAHLNGAGPPGMRDSRLQPHAQQQAGSGSVRDHPGGASPAGQQRMGMPQDPLQGAATAEAAARSSSESSRFSMESLRRSIESARYPGSVRTSSFESTNGQSQFSGSPRSTGHGHDSLFAYQPSHNAPTPMASVPEAEPMPTPAAMTSVAELKESNRTRE